MESCLADARRRSLFRVCSFRANQVAPIQIKDKHGRIYFIFHLYPIPCPMPLGNDSGLSRASGSTRGSPLFPSVSRLSFLVAIPRFPPPTRRGRTSGIQRQASPLYASYARSCAILSARGARVSYNSRACSSRGYNPRTNQRYAASLAPPPRVYLSVRIRAHLGPGPLSPLRLPLGCPIPTCSSANPRVMPLKLSERPLSLSLSALQILFVRADTLQRPRVYDRACTCYTLSQLRRHSRRLNFGSGSSALNFHAFVPQRPALPADRRMDSALARPPRSIDREGWLAELRGETDDPGSGGGRGVSKRGLGVHQVPGRVRLRVSAKK